MITLYCFGDIFYGSYNLHEHCFGIQVICYGYEHDVFDCSHTDGRNDDCHVRESIAIRCYDKGESIS